MHRRFYAVRLVVLVVLLLCSNTGYSRPDMSPLGPNIADKGSAFYRFTVNTFDSADGKRHYKVWTAVPKKNPPPAGYPVLYLLDGNAVMDRLSEPFLQKLSERDPPVLVVVGYQTDLPFDLSARSYDYTPAIEGNAQNLRGRIGGGSAIFRQLLETTIAPQAEKGITINTQKRALWGHSYGGLFVLDSYLASTFFSAYYSAVPSLERNNFRLLNAMETLPPAAFSNKPLWFLEGDGDRKAHDENSAPDVLSAVQHSVTRLRTRGIPSTCLLYPGLTHGAMFAASMNAAMLHMSGEALPASH